jgi:hypothetical protein
MSTDMTTSLVLPTLWSMQHHDSDEQFLSHFNSTFPQDVSFWFVTPTPSLVSAVISALLKKPYSMESLQAMVLVPTPTGQPGVDTQLTWESTPFSKPLKTKYQRYKSSSTEYDKAHLHVTEIPSSLEWLKITYGVLAKCLPCWVTRMNAVGKVDYPLKRLLHSFTKQDMPPNRVKPVPIQVLRHIANSAISGNHVILQATADMIILAFLFLL